MEITYTAVNLAGEAEILGDRFPQRAKADLNYAETALKSVADLTWHIPMKELQEDFIQGCRGHQLLIVQPTIAAMVYAKNAKQSSYTGFW